VIVFNFSGHGHFDLAAYDAYPEEEIEKAMHSLPEI